jgi:mono/diheme cytochrome c family protein
MRQRLHPSAPSAIVAAPPPPSSQTLLALFAASLAVAGCGGSDSPATPLPAPTVEARGQALFVATGVNCVQCHTDAATLRRDAPDAAVLADRIAAAIANNTGRMGDAQYGYASLTRAELLDVGARDTR